MKATEINDWFHALPEGFSLLAFLVLIIIYAHLFLGFWMVRRRIKQHVIKYFVARTGLVFMLFLFKSIYIQGGVLDIFYPIYIICYLDGLILLNGYGFYRCQNMKQAFKKIIKFNSVKR